jgi:hypothetical protein
MPPAAQCGALPSAPSLCADKFDPYKNPDKFVAAFYAQNQALINELSVTAKSSEVAPDERLKALQRLHDEFPDVAIPVLAELTEDANLEVAGKATELMASASMMMNHRMHGAAESHSHNPVEVYLMRKHELIYSTLREAARDERNAVNAPAAKALASQSDEKGLEIVSESRGLYGDRQYVQIMSLASPQVAGKYIEDYLDSPDKEIQALVGSYLVESPLYAAAAKEKILLNEDAPLDTRIEVAKHVYDVKHLMPLVVSPHTPAGLYSEVINTYVDRSAPELSLKEIEMLLEGIRSRWDDIAAFWYVAQRRDQLSQQKSSQRQ